MKDLDDVPKKVLREMTLVQASSMEDVLMTALTRMPAPLKPGKPRKARTQRKPAPKPARVVPARAVARRRA
jgi:hypothetical protein